MSRFLLIACAALAFFLAGCQQNTQPEPEPAAVMVKDEPVVRAAPPPAPPPSAPIRMMPKLTDTKLVYFAYDRSDIRTEDRAIVAAHAEWLADNPRLRVRLEGHADERGSREYNIGLGERRAQSVRQALMLQGVAGSQIDTLSYGEERPAVRGQGDFAWSQNRRVEIIYLP